MPPLNGQSNNVNTPGVTGDNTAGGSGVFGDSNSGPGVSGHSITAAAIVGESDSGSGVSALGHGAAPALESVNDNATDNAGPGLRARSAAAGVIGESTTWMGVFGLTQSSTGGNGVMGQAIGTGAGVFGESSDGIGVLGQTSGITTSSAAVRGVVPNMDAVGPAVFGENQGSGPGVLGTAIHSAGVTGLHGDPRLQETTAGNEGAMAGVFGASEIGAGIVGYSRNVNSWGVWAMGGILASPINHPLAGHFAGDVQVDGDLYLPGADCAEQFDVADGSAIEEGDVVVIDEGGALRRSGHAYDRKVAGVISGAGGYRPGIVLDRQATSVGRKSVALVGKVYCKVDAGYSPIGVGDLLTSSPTPGHAMKATDPARAFGAVLGKALGACSAGTSVLPILVCLQ